MMGHGPILAAPDRMSCESDRHSITIWGSPHGSRNRTRYSITIRGAGRAPCPPESTLQTSAAISR